MQNVCVLNEGCRAVSVTFNKMWAAVRRWSAEAMN